MKNNNSSKYICPYCNKEFDNQFKLGGHKGKCKYNPNYNKGIENWKKSFTSHQFNQNNSYNKKQILYCEYCNKECSSLNSLTQHQNYCQNNPNRKYRVSNWINYNKTREPINQFIKAKKNGMIYKMSDETKEKIRQKALIRKLDENTIKSIQNTINNKIITNDWHNNNLIKIWYKNNCFDSSWEIKFVQYLDEHSIIWERPKQSFEYLWNNSIHKYYPDIYLPIYNLYIEIKGIPNERDYAKWSQFQNNLDIYDGEDLYHLGILDSFDKRHIIKEQFKFKHLKL